MSVNVSIPAPPQHTFFSFFCSTVFAVELFSLLRRLLPSYALMNICRVICLCAFFEIIVLKYQLFPLICLEDLFAPVSFTKSYCYQMFKVKWASLVAQKIKHLPAMQETRVRSLGREDPLEKEMSAHSSSLAWEIPWGLQESETT